MEIQAIETRYAGCRFRSRLEARWAVFFDHLEVKWEYEPEGFETSVGRYLPDFRIQVPGDGYPYWFEVKPPHAWHDDRHRVLCVETAMPTIVARGMPRDYRDQKREHESALTAMLWGDQLEGARYPAGDAQPETYPCAFIGRQQGMYLDIPGLPREFLPYPDDQWDTIHKARAFHAEAREDVHLALYTPGVFNPADSPDVDRAYAAARSARFEERDR